MQYLPTGFRCEECRRLVRELKAARDADCQTLRRKFQEMSTASGRDLRHVGISWVRSVATMPDDEMKALLESHYPASAEAQQKCTQHEAATGHSVKAWYMLSNYTPPAGA